jgi:hypothetical protein
MMEIFDCVGYSYEDTNKKRAVLVFGKSYTFSGGKSYTFSGSTVANIFKYHVLDADLFL